MKKALSILFLFIFLYNIAGYFIVFTLQQFSVREEMELYIKKNMADKELERVVVSNTDIAGGSSDFRFKDDNNEFVYKGKLYDIVRQKTDGVNTIFYCINDNNEERLIEGLSQHIQRNTDQNLPAKNNALNLVNNIIKDALPDKHCEQLCNFYSKISFYISYNSLIREQFIPTPTPPPKG